MSKSQKRRKVKRVKDQNRKLRDDWGEVTPTNRKNRPRRKSFNAWGQWTEEEG